jgi:hypothetical protein
VSLLSRRSPKELYAGIDLHSNNSSPGISDAEDKQESWLMAILYVQTVHIFKMIESCSAVQGSNISEGEKIE